MSETVATPGTKIVYEGSRGELVLGIIERAYTDAHGFRYIQWRCTSNRGHRGYQRGITYRDLDTWVHPRSAVKIWKYRYTVTPTRWAYPACDPQVQV